MEILSSKDREADELELGLGLSLGSGCTKGGGAGAGSGGGSGGVKILTAKYFPSVINGHHGCCGVNISGNKRAAADSPGSPLPVSQVVGWPPIRTYRINNLATQTKPEEGKKFADHNNDSMNINTFYKTSNDRSNGNNNKEVNNNGSFDKNKSPMKESGQVGFVKVNMDGAQIGRKVDLDAHGCYETLAQAIEEMFFKPSSKTTNNLITSRGDLDQQQRSRLLDGSSDFVLTYEDKEGDWMLVGDVPWGMFISIVKRLRIMRSCETNGLAAPRIQERSMERRRTKPI